VHDESAAPHRGLAVRSDAPKSVATSHRVVRWRSLTKLPSGTLWLVVLPLLISGVAAAAFGQNISEFAILTANSVPLWITAGPDGALWFTEVGGDGIGRITTAGAVTEFPIRTTASGLWAITAGPDGALWFTERGANRIGRISTSGTITEFAIPTPNSEPTGIVAGPDGALWFTEVFLGNIGRITTDGDVTEFPIPTSSSGPVGIVVGSDGALWFTEHDANKIGRITTAGVVTEFPIPTFLSNAGSIIAGPDDALWFIEGSGNKVGRITTSGNITEFAVPTPDSVPTGIASGPDGALWFTEAIGGKIGRITTSGTIAEFTIPTSNSQPSGIVAGHDGALWFTEPGTNQIGQIRLAGPRPCVADSATLCLSGGRFEVRVAWSVPSQGRSGIGTAVALTGDTGQFWFFNSANIELVIKVLDARGVNGHFWVFYGALSDVQYAITVTDSVTGAVKNYVNAAGTLASVADTSAFSPAGASLEPPSAASVEEIETRLTGERYGPYASLTQAVVTPKAAAVEACTPGGTTLCLNQARFQVTVEWEVPSEGRAGHGTAVALTGDTGYFWFFNSDNVEFVIKVLDGRAINGHFWVFYGALSDVQYTITVMDTQTRAVKTYTNPSGTLASVADTSVF